MKALMISRRELSTYFSSPAAFIFLGGFLLVSLFVFFWVETFFARNITDVRPLFEWMPVLLIFLCSAITMRMWSEERRSGTLEFLLTSPVASIQFVLGKFAACLALVILALLLTLPLPITVASMGPLDWGPVIGAYLATLCLASAYIAIGLFVSARNDNQIVSLMISVLLCGIFYSLGSNALADLLGDSKISEWLTLLGSGARFEAITRGVLDVRDLYYYFSIVGIFLCLNVYSIEKLRWSQGGQNGGQLRWRLVVLLFIANFAAANVWLSPMTHLRADITQGKIYSLSDASHTFIRQLQEPLLIRGYFSSQTHPLLSPLAPQLRDLMREYEVAGQGNIRVELVDPLEEPELEREAAEKYGIKPIAFQTADKYQAALVNSYFDIVVQYGDEYQVLGFRDLIDVKMLSETEVDVQLRNPEYDITRTLKQVLYAYQSGGNLFLNITKPVTFYGYISNDTLLPEQLQDLRKDVEKTVNDISAQAANKFQVQMLEPEANGGELAQRLQSEYGFRPMAASLLDPNSFWFYLVMTDGEQIIQVPLPEDLSAAGVKRGIEAALKRFSSGFLKTIALYTPPAQPTIPGLGMQGGGLRFTLLEDHLRQNANVKKTDLSSGQVPDDADLLMVVAPESLDDKQRFAIDQFLMQGGTVILATSPYVLTSQGNLGVEAKDSGLEDWLSHHGVDVGYELVLDLQNTPFPIPVQRDVGGFMVQELRMIEYPYFPDIREEGMDQSVGIFAGIPQLTLNWPSPIRLKDSFDQFSVNHLLYSSNNAWLSASTNIQPDFARFGELGFEVGKEQSKQLFGVNIEGSFQSFYQGKPSPLMATEEENETEAEAAVFSLNRVIEKSSQAARLIVFSSNTFLSDDIVNLVSSASGNLYTNALQVMANTVDWALEEKDLLSIRGRDHFSRTLKPLDKEQQQYWEYMNYGLALGGLLVVYLALWINRSRKKAGYRRLLAQGGQLS